ncbi:MAG: hypothetical protein M2R45_02986 [Verrucomicrobia subdivision 3 bacterium]|nr:hypothetical protein [Limisphaerales bacterium]MCS1416528.1 hypothetical protein [Limisphaerales bacterium]
MKLPNHLWVLFTLSVGNAAYAASSAPDRVEFFESRIRPILAQDCYECHGTASKQKGGLNLDHRAAWQAGGDSGTVIVPGKPEESLLIQAIRHEDEDLTMPKSGAKLDDTIINDFIQWIRMGAPDPRDAPPTPEQLKQDQDWAAVLKRRKSWWSFQPITNPTSPSTDWSYHPVDQFLEAKRQAAGLEANGPANLNILIRRLYFALIGLPPTTDQIDSFLTAYQNNPSLAMANQIDELLASPHFGERWARHWMDWIRYAESHGSEGDPRIVNAHLYRDYLIRALNDDVPYDQLVREHVAGDQLESPRINEELAINESLIGTAHWRMVFHGFAPTDALEEKVRFTDDQINVFSKAFLGLTISCARCHNHKFDAISQKDYYALFGIMGSTRPSRKAIDLPEKQNRHREAIDALKPRIRDAIADDWLRALPLLREKLVDAEGPVANAEKKIEFLHPLYALQKSDTPSSTWTELKAAWQEDDKAWQDHRNRQYTQRWHLGQSDDNAQWYKEGTGLSNGAAQAGAFSLRGGGNEAISGIHPSGTYTHLQSTKHGGLLTSPDITLEEDYEIWLRLKGADRSMSRYVVFNYPRNGTVYPVREMRDGQAKWHWQKYNVDYWRGDDIHIEIATASDAPLLVRDEPRSWFGIREAIVIKKGEPTPPQDPRRYLAPVFAEAETLETVDANQLVSAYVSAVEEAIKAWKADKTTDDQAELLDKCRRLELLPNELNQLPNAKPLLTSYRQLENEIPIATRVPTVAEWSAQDQPLFDRGNHKKPLDRVPRRFLESIDDSPYETQSSGRRQLAENLIRDNNPLTRRVIVNRLWHHLFGKGIVATPDNLGRLGAQPTHPELLDHLATYFVERADWSIKRMIHYLVTTRTWQLASEPSETAQKQDPNNDLLSHFSIRRLEAEAIRDSLLHVSGKLDHTTFGSPVSGDQPKRSIYVNVIRNRLDPFLSEFDAPVPFSAQGRRNATTVPSQSLTMMNGEFVVKTARHWGQSLSHQAKESGIPTVVDEIWRQSFARSPTPEERTQTLAFIEQQGADYAALAQSVAKQREVVKALSQNLADLRDSAKQRLQPNESGPTQDSTYLNPIAQWLFDEDGKDSIGSLHAELKGDARIEDGALTINGAESFAQTARLKNDLEEKTLEVWVQLDNLDQRGGGAISVQTPGGGIFDAIVFAERDRQQWMAGSDGFSRTKDFDGPREDKAHKTPVHLAIVYDKDGMVTGYRNGEPYGNAYKSSGPRRFEKNEAEVIFGLRHSNPSDGKTLKGRILEARLYDRALTAKEVATTAAKQTDFIAQSDLLAALSEEERAQWKKWTREKETQEASLARLEEIAPPAGKEEVWADLALAIFNTKEFIYVR